MGFEFVSSNFLKIVGEFWVFEVDIQVPK